MNIENKINYYKSISIAKELVCKKLITQLQCDKIIERLKYHYNINKNLDIIDISNV